VYVVVVVMVGWHILQLDTPDSQSGAGAVDPLSRVAAYHAHRTSHLPHLREESVSLWNDHVLSQHEFEDIDSVARPVPNVTLDTVSIPSNITSDEVYELEKEFLNCLRDEFHKVEDFYHEQTTYFRDQVSFHLYLSLSPLYSLFTTVYAAASYFCVSIY